MKPMSKIVRTIAMMIYPFILAFGAYIVLHGHLSPGGGFQGGAVIASGFAMMLIAFGDDSKRYIKKNLFSVLESIGALAFLGLALLGIGTSFFYNTISNSGGLFGEQVAAGINSGNLNTGGILVYMNCAVGLKVLAGLGSVVFLLAFAFNGEDENE